MGKKTNEDAILIKRLIKEGMPAWQISKKHGTKKQKISYWKHHEIKTVIRRKSKLTDNDINYMVKLAENQITSNMGTRKFKKFEEEGEN